MDVPLVVSSILGYSLRKDEFNRGKVTCTIKTTVSKRYVDILQLVFSIDERIKYTSTVPLSIQLLQFFNRTSIVQIYSTHPVITPV